MEKAEVLRLFLGKGYQIDVESLNYFSKNEKQLQKFLSEMELQKFPSTITKDFIDSFLQSDVEIFSATVEKKQLTAEEIAKILMQKFAIIKRILITHLDLINLLSVSKISQKTKKFSLIGIVSRIDDASGTITVADDTGETDLRIEKKLLDDILANDVLGFICEYDEVIKVRNVIFPDVPLRRNIKNLSEVKYAVFTEKISKEILDWCKEQKNPIYLFTFLHPAEQTEVPQNVKLVFSGEGPSFAMISRAFSIVLFDGSFLNNIIDDKKIDDFLIFILNTLHN